ncbi:alpha/beta hydrolase [Mucilaginibacter terrenus]|uniref:Alpha/beta hydrolase n=1 Tax=Mucilaginibacter terrenus TaxID=2482727 RepID=A0A3E2NM23_9SPHI|nr:alpha/beta hydrolase [Mucilaginibacter terrenus]RFZ82039.1 alpha/beta hydrolase [Mucilaginibacter terrenus]
MDKTFSSGYKPVNGINMYYEIHGSGERPLVLVHGGGSTIYTTFGRILPLLAQKRQIIAVELQAHGHTSDRNAPETFEQDADDVAGLLKELSINKADLFGFSNGGNTVLQVAIRHPEVVNKIVVASAFYKRDGMHSWFWDFMKNASLDYMPLQLQEAFLAINPSQEALLNMHDKDANRMRNFADWPDEYLLSIQAPTLLLAGDKDVMTAEHTVAMHRLIPNSRLVILPSDHGTYIGEVMTANPDSPLPKITADLILDFLEH